MSGFFVLLRRLPYPLDLSAVCLCFPSTTDDFEVTKGVGGRRGGVVW